MSRARQIFLDNARAGIAPEPVLLVSEWADKNRILSQKAASEPGPYRTSRTPYLREIMDCLSPSHPATDVVFWKATQVGGTETGNNWVGYLIDQAPGPIMMVQPTVDVAEKWSKQRFSPMIQDTACLRGKVILKKSRSSGNTILLKEFPGGLIIITGANSSTGLRSIPVRFLFLDEVDAYPADVDGEGDPIDLAIKRTETFPRKKRFYCSTGLEKETSRIEPLYLASDQRRFYVPCPHCQKTQSLKWAQLKWDKGNPRSAHYVCEHCGGVIGEHHKTRMLEAGEWIAESPGPDKAAGFHLNALYSPIGWKSWRECASQFAEAYAKRDVTKIKVFVNTVIAETWEEQGESVEADTLLSRREFYPAPAPRGVLVVTAGVDVQDDRIEAEILGTGIDHESWSLGYYTLIGDPARRPVWEQLTALLAKPIRHEAGIDLRVLVTCIDSGFKTDAVYKYCRAFGFRAVYATKGMAGAGRPVITLSKSKNKRGIKPVLVGVDTVKEIVFSRLKIQERGPGFCHFPAENPYDEVYFEMLTAEKLVTRYHMGHPVRAWVKQRPRNEALDCRVLALAAVEILNPDLPKVAENMFARVGPLPTDGPPGGGDTTRQSPPMNSPALSTPQRRSNKNFATSWKKW